MYSEKYVLWKQKILLQPYSNPHSSYHSSLLPASGLSMQEINRINGALKSRLEINRPSVCLSVLCIHPIWSGCWGCSRTPVFVAVWISLLLGIFPYVKEEHQQELNKPLQPINFMLTREIRRNPLYIQHKMKLCMASYLQLNTYNANFKSAKTSSPSELMNH